VYGGGGDSTNPSNLGNDFVELFNADFADAQGVFRDAKAERW